MEGSSSSSPDEAVCSRSSFAASRVSDVDGSCSVGLSGVLLHVGSSFSFFVSITVSCCFVDSCLASLLLLVVKLFKFKVVEFVVAM